MRTGIGYNRPPRSTQTVPRGSSAAVPATISVEAAFFAQLGLTPAFPLAIFVGLIEVAGGLLLVAGAFTLVASALLTVNMLVAVWTVHLASGFFLNWTMAAGVGHGYEFNLVLIAALVSLMLTGPGTLSFDRHRARAAETQAFGRARMRA